MSSGAIIPTFDPGEDSRASLRSGPERIAIQHLTFQACKKAFGHRVVKTVANAAHRQSHTELSAAGPEGNRGVLGGFNRSLQHLSEGVAMAIQKGSLNHAGRPKLYSPGQPTAGRPVRQQFWLGIYSGLSTVEAA